jgi:hypothetical protein
LNRKIITILTLFLAIMIFSTGINTVLASTTIYEHQYAGGVAFIDIPGQPRFDLAFSRFCGHFGRISDRLSVYMITESGMKTVMGVDDNPTRKAFSDDVGGSKTVLVKRWQLQIFTFCRTTIAYWTIPLEVPATVGIPGAPPPYNLPTPAVTIPPGLVILKGSGEVITRLVEDIPIGPNGYTLTIDVKGNYAAQGTLFCPGWDFYGSIEGMVQTDSDYIWTTP